MKKRSIKLITIIAGIAMISFGSSCNKLKDFDTTNANPAAVTNPIPYALLTNVERQLGAFASNARSAIYCQYFSEAEYPSIGQYAVPQLDFGANYSGPLYDLQTVINVSTNPAEIAMARILKVYIYWTTVDRWGPIPYETALQAKIPTYSKEEFIYKDMIKELTEAKVQMPASGSQRGDILFNSDFSKWKKLANSMRMLMALRLSNVYPGASDYAATEFKAALNDAAGSIEDNSSNLKVSYVGGGGDANAYANQFWYTNQQARDNGYSVPLNNMLSAIGDTRTSVFGSSSNAVPYGYSEGLINAWRQANPTWARVFAPAYRTETSPVYVVTAAQVLLARAEAADRGWTSDNAATVYTAGINAAFTQWGLSSPSASYMSNANVALTNPTGTGANLKNIATQYYFASFPDGTQGWSNWRRTGFPVLTPGAYPISAAHTTIPRRLTYGTTEYSNNIVNVTIANGWLNLGDVQESKIWWDR